MIGSIVALCVVSLSGGNCVCGFYFWVLISRFCRDFLGYLSYVGVVDWISRFVVGRFRFWGCCSFEMVGCFWVVVFGLCLSNVSK